MKEGEKNITSPRKHAKKVNCWGGIYKGGKISLKIFTNNMDSEFYVKILQEKYKEMNEVGNGCFKDWILQYDNDPKHKSKLAIDFIKKKKIKTLDWPPYSPDLSPIENIWSIISNTLKQKDIKSQSELMEEVENAWQELEQVKIDNAIDSMPSRIRD